MKEVLNYDRFFATERIWKILWHLAPPVMLAQLIQAMYNIVDSYFIGQYSLDGLTALSVIMPIQLVAIALAVGTGVGVNTHMARLAAQGKNIDAKKTAGTGMILAIISWAVFALFSLAIIKPYVLSCTDSPLAIEYALQYGYIVCIGSLGLFLESIWTKVHQARGNMVIPMIAQVTGAFTNIILDAILIFGLWGAPALGVVGAAVATVIGQTLAALIVAPHAMHHPPHWANIKQYVVPIYHLGYPSIVMQLLFTVYIVSLNIILGGFCDEAVTVLGIYYKLQNFFFIPFIALETCIVPVLSYNYAVKNYHRCKEIMTDTYLASVTFGVLAGLCFVLAPTQILQIFSTDALVLAIGAVAFPIIGTSFAPAVFSMMPATFFQAIGNSKTSTALAVIRPIFCLTPLFWLFAQVGLNYTWLAFPLAEVITGIVGIGLYYHKIRQWKHET